MIKSSVLEAINPSRVRAWKELEGRTKFALGGVPLEFVQFEYPGNAAAVVILAPKDGARVVVGTYVASVGGNGAEIEIVQIVAAPSGTSGIALLKLTKELRGFEDDNKHVDAASEDSYVVLAFTASQAWLATDEEELHGFDTGTIQTVDSTLRLVGCLGKRKKAVSVLAFDPATALFRPVPASVGKQVTCPIKRH